MPIDHHKRILNNVKHCYAIITRLNKQKEIATDKITNLVINLETEISTIDAEIARLTAKCKK